MGLFLHSDRAEGQGRVRGASEPMVDLILYGVAFIFLGLCLLYVRAADKL